MITNLRWFKSLSPWQSVQAATGDDYRPTVALREKDQGRAVGGAVPQGRCGQALQMQVGPGQLHTSPG